MSLHRAPASGAESDVSIPDGFPGGARQHALDITKTNPSLEHLTKFQYDSQLDQHHIRLLAILPDSPDGIVRCKLETHALAMAPEYNALSYVWGNGAPDKAIVCSGGSLDITQSLYAALLAMCKQRRIEYSAHVPACQLVWIDQICINQNDEKERNQQVRIMQDIFHRATKVLISLGDDFDDLAAPVDRLLTQICNIDPLLQLPRTRCFPKGTVLAELGLPDSTDQSWLALRKMLLLPYFERVWVIQEVLQAREPLILFQGGVISWKNFLEAMAWLYVENFDIPNQLVLEPHFSIPHIKIMEFYLGHKFLRHTLPTKFYDLVREIRLLKSTDPRDKIFALAGIADDREEVAIEYERNEWEVFEDFARYAIRAERSLNILSDVTHDDQNRGDTPSWVPRWNAPAPIPTLRERGFNASGSSEAVIGPQQEPRVLKVKGKEMTVITSRVLRFDFDGDKDEIFPEMISRLVASGFIKREEAPRDSFVNRVKELAWCLILGSYSHVDETPTGDDADDKVLDDFCAFAANGFLLSIHNDNIEAMEGFVSVAKIVFDANMDSLSNKLPGGLSAGVLTWSEDLKSRLPVLFPRLFNDGSNADELVDGILRAWNLEAFRRFDRAAVIRIAPRSIFITDEGSMGVGPPNLEKDDIVCVLYGGSTPYALRPTSTPDEYIFLGDCYVHRWMHGEALQRSGHKQDKWFRLV